MNFGFQISWNPRGSSQTWSQLDDSMTFWWFCLKNSSRNSNALSCSVLKLPCVLTTPFFWKTAMIVWRKSWALPITILGTASWVTTASFSNFLGGLKMRVYQSHNSWQSCWYLHRILLKTRTQQIPHVWTNPLISLQTSRPRQRFAHGRSQRCCHPPAVVHSSSSGLGATQIPRNDFVSELFPVASLGQDCCGHWPAATLMIFFLDFADPKGPERSFQGSH